MSNRQRTYNRFNNKPALRGISAPRGAKNRKTGTSGTRSLICPAAHVQQWSERVSNLLYDMSQVPIPTVDVDPEQIAKPRPWSMNAIARFILFIGPCSSIFDYTTFFIMLYVFGCWVPTGASEEQLRSSASLFQTGWFVESLLTQALIIHVIRTKRIPFLQSWSSLPLIVPPLSSCSSAPFAAFFAPWAGLRIHSIAAHVLAHHGCDVARYVLLMQVVKGRVSE